MPALGYINSSMSPPSNRHCHFRCHARVQYQRLLQEAIAALVAKQVELRGQEFELEVEQELAEWTYVNLEERLQWIPKQIKYLAKKGRRLNALIEEWLPLECRLPVQQQSEADVKKTTVSYQSELGALRVQQEEEQEKNDRRKERLGVLSKEIKSVAMEERRLRDELGREVIPPGVSRMTPSRLAAGRRRPQVGVQVSAPAITAAAAASAFVAAGGSDSDDDARPSKQARTHAPASEGGSDSDDDARRSQRKASRPRTTARAPQSGSLPVSTWRACSCCYGRRRPGYEAQRQPMFLCPAAAHSVMHHCWSWTRGRSQARSMRRAGGGSRWRRQSSIRRRRSSRRSRRWSTRSWTSGARIRIWPPSNSPPRRTVASART